MIKKFLGNKAKTPTAGTVRVSNELTIYSEINNMNTLAVTTPNVTMSSIDFLNNIINPARLLAISY